MSLTSSTPRNDACPTDADHALESAAASAIHSLAAGFFADTARNRVVLKRWLRLPLPNRAARAPASTHTSFLAKRGGGRTRHSVIDSMLAMRRERNTHSNRTYHDIVALIEAILTVPLELRITKIPNGPLTLHFFANEPCRSLLTFDATDLHESELQALVGLSLLRPHWARGSGEELVAEAVANVAFETSINRLALVAALFDAALVAEPHETFERATMLLEAAAYTAAALPSLLTLATPLCELARCMRCADERVLRPTAGIDRAALQRMNDYAFKYSVAVIGADEFYADIMHRTNL